MKTVADLVRSWLPCGVVGHPTTPLKAESDLTNAELCLDADKALDTVCFHAQQAAEKFIGGLEQSALTLIAQRIDFPFIHNLEKLIELGAKYDPAFINIKPLGQKLTPYAVELRYDGEFWPTTATASQALDAALTIKKFVVDRLSMSLEMESEDE